MTAPSFGAGRGEPYLHHLARRHPASLALRSADGSSRPLDAGSWVRPAGRADLTVLDRVAGPVLDVGCGPGRMLHAARRRSLPALGIDVAPHAVEHARRDGALALRRSVFDRLPLEGRWRSLLLMDGNIGIGGDPVALLARVRQLLDPRGRVVVELAAPGAGLTRTRAVLSCDGIRSRPFDWAVVGADAAPSLAAEAGLQVSATHATGERFYAVLEEAA